MKIIFCLGLKRSGSTLQYNLVRRVLEGNRCSYVNLGYKTKEEISEIDMKPHGADYLLVKCHDYDVQGFDGNEKYTFFIHRDIRDTYVSLRQMWGVGSDSISNLVVSHQNACNYAKSHGFMIQRYEEIYTNQSTALDQIAKFLELECVYASDQDIMVPSMVRSVFSKVFLSLKMVARGRKHLPLPISRMELQIKQFFYSKILKLSVDPGSQIHPDHRSKTGGEPGAWKTLLTDEEHLKFTELLTCMMSSRKILFFDAAASGHHGEYFENLIAGFTDEQAELSILVVHPALEESLVRWKQASNSSISIQCMTATEIDYMVAAKNIVQVGRRQLEVLERYIEKFEATSVCLMHINLHQYALGGWQPPRTVKITGILFNPYTPAERSFGIKAKALGRITALRKRIQLWLMLLNSSIYKIYLLNDERMSNLFNSWCPGRQVFETLVDPLPAALGETLPIFNKGEEVYTFLLAGSMTARKGCLETLEAFRTLMPQCARPVELRLVGRFRPDSKDYKIKVSEQIDILNEECPQLLVELVDEHVSFEALDREFNRADCILAPYLNFYGSSGVMGHACRHEKPMITCRNGLLGELVTSMEIGLAVEPGDASTFAKALHQLIKNELLYNVETARDYCRSANHVEFASTLIRGL